MICSRAPSFGRPGLRRRGTPRDTAWAQRHPSSVGSWDHRSVVIYECRRLLLAARGQLGIPITVLADTLSVACERLRRLEIGTRSQLDDAQQPYSPTSQPNLALHG